MSRVAEEGGFNMEALKQPDAVLIGAGIMSVTLATLLKRLDPSMEIVIYEVLGSEAQESPPPAGHHPA
jgi:hypothetical protein